MSLKSPLQRERCLYWLLTQSDGLTHLVAEEKLDSEHPITTARNRVGELRRDYRWPIYGVNERHQKGTHKRYFMDWAALSRQAGVEAMEIRRLAWTLAAGAPELASCADFCAWAKEHATQPEPSRKGKQLDFFKEICGVYDLKRHGGRP